MRLIFLYNILVISLIDAYSNIEDAKYQPSFLLENYRDQTGTKKKVFQIYDQFLQFHRLFV